MARYACIIRREKKDCRKTSIFAHSQLRKMMYGLWSALLNINVVLSFFNLSSAG